MTRRTLFAAAALALAVAAPQAQAALLIDQANFTGACGSSLSCVGASAVTANGDMRLTPAQLNQGGAAFSKAAVSLGAGATFSTSFQFRMSQAGGWNPADGLTFVLAKANEGLGDTGIGLGYAGVKNSVAIEFDTFDNSEGSSNHVAVDVDGALSNLARVSPYGVTSCTLANYGAAGCMSNGKVWTAFINYDGTAHKLNVSAQEAGSALVQLITDFNIDIADVLGTSQAFVGFTAATGAGYENHDILNWQLANDTSIHSKVPEPASLALLLLAGGAALGAKRRRRG